MIEPTPLHFTVRTPGIADQRRRLARTRFPDQAPGEAWAHGADVAYLRNLRNTGATAQGEHFAALEQPALLADEVSAFFRELR